MFVSHSWQRSHAPSIPSLCLSVESRPAPQAPTNLNAAACGKFPCCYSSRSQWSCPSHLWSVHCIHWQHGARHLAQQGHLRARPLWFSPSRKTPQAKVPGVWSHSSFEACCDALHFLEHRRLHFALYTSTMSWPRNVTLPLIFYDGYMVTWRSTLSTSLGATWTWVLCPQLVTCSRIQSCQHPVIRFCGDLVRWRSRIVSALGFSSCQSVHMSGVWIHTAATNSVTPHLALDPVTNPLTVLCFSTVAPPTCLAPIASCAVSKRNKEVLSADITNKSVCGDDVLDCDVAQPYLLIMCKSLGASCVAPHWRSDLCFKSLSLSPCDVVGRGVVGGRGVCLVCVAARWKTWKNPCVDSKNASVCTFKRSPCMPRKKEEKKKHERKWTKMKEHERTWKKMKETERHWTKRNENERKWKKMKENERKWNKMKQNERKQSAFSECSLFPRELGEPPGNTREETREISIYRTEIEKREETRLRCVSHLIEGTNLAILVRRKTKGN